MNFKLFLTLIIVITIYSCNNNTQNSTKEEHRLGFHFTPKANWMNDPNGLVYYNGEYHLFYQYYPDSTVWGPMHWGHAVSTNLNTWQDLPIALFPDSIGYIFSGSIVIDSNNTSGFKNGNELPMVAIYAYHNPILEKQNSLNTQTQGIAYSNDKGRSWKKYNLNPVLKNGKYKDFRDPKVFWYELEKKWVMSLAVGNRIQFYSSKNLKEWQLTGEFGEDNQGSHNGVWECPDLIKIKIKNTNQTKWVLLVSINPGGLRGGSGTQYFIGDFNGKTFKNENKKDKIMWLDYGADNYAGVTWNNTPNDTILFLGWMSNWLYAQKVPTEKWRSAMTIPRILTLQNTNNGLILSNNPSSQINNLRINKNNILENKLFKTQTALNEINLSINLKETTSNEFGVEISNDLNEKLIVGFDKTNNQLFIDRTNAGKNKFDTNFASKHYATRIINDSILNLKIFIDVASVEVFCDEGTLTMTEIFFPNEEMKNIKLFSKNGKIDLLQNEIYSLKNTLNKN